MPEQTLKDKPTVQKARPPVSERRFLVRYPSSAGAVVIRDTDFMRSGLDAKVRNVSLGGLGLDMATPLDLNEQVKIQLRNDIQRFQKEVRGVVRHVTEVQDGVVRVGIELLLRLTPLEVGLLRMGIKSEGAQGRLRWL